MISQKVYLDSGTFDPPIEAAGYEIFRVTLVAAGGGGASGGSYVYSAGAVMCGSGGGSGAPGAIIQKVMRIKEAIAITLSAGGTGAAAPAAGANDGIDGGTGGSSSIGDYLTVSGGRGGTKGLKGVANTAVTGGAGGLKSATIPSTYGAVVLDESAGGKGSDSVVGAGAYGGCGGAVGKAPAQFAQVAGLGGKIYSAQLNGYGGAGWDRAGHATSNGDGLAGGNAACPGGGGGGGGGAAWGYSSGDKAGGAGGNGAKGAAIFEWGNAIEALASYV